MFNQLIESKAQKQKMAGGTVFSIVLHTVLIAGAVYATARAGVKDEKSKAEKIQFVEMKKEPPKVPDKPPPPKEVVVKPPPPKGFQVLRAPVKIDIKIPEIDLSKSITNESDFSGKGVKGGTGSGVVGGVGPVTNQTYFEFQVEKPAEMLQDSPKPKYPSVLESSGIAGEVQAQFVVNSSGKADMDSFKVLKSTNELFTQAVKSVLPRMRFSPAQIGGKPVNQLVQQSFQFAVPR
ncbi:MAG: periplasmic protein TonB [Gemmatimonadaceae bacterium]|jgi:protein TonB|nr:periplasmic protein TonB [Gemmatimonadaceae bacterium]MEA2765585.1 periplasmic protein TonB [Gemmatimonadaceae bacterium]